jgi:MtaA/CmuA family methyltransferase
MALLDILNWVGQRKWMRPVGLLMLTAVSHLQFTAIVKLAGRRMVCAPAGAPAILLTHSDMQQTLNDPELLFKASKFTVEKMGFDTLNTVVDMSVEAEACGCQIQYRDNHLPDVCSHPVKTRTDIQKLRVPDPYSDGRMPVFVESMRLMKNRCTMLKVAVVSGPFTLAMLLAGSEIYIDLRKDPLKVKALLEYCQKVITDYGRALIQAGADIMVIAEPMGSQMSPAAYEEFSATYTRAILRTFNRPCGLHICGKTSHIMQKMAESGVAFLSIDDVDMNFLVNNLPESVVIMGNYSPARLKIETPAQIMQATRTLLETTRYRKGYIVGPGCDLAPETSLENIRSFVRTVKG